MLVLSREQNEKIVFPNLGITIEVLRINRKRVRMGIDAPPSVKVLRHEIADDEAAKAPASNSLIAPQQKLSHAVRNRLNAATLALHLLQKQLERGLVDDCDATLERALRELQRLDREFGEGATSTSNGESTAKVSRRALLVEDNANESELLAGYLRMSGFEVETACDGRVAIDALSCSQKPDVVLLDMRMPRCDGRETINSIRQNPKLAGLKVFAVSGANPAELGIPTGPEGVDRWFQKPIDPQRLVSAISGACAEPAAV